MGQLLERIEGKPARPDNGLGPEHRPNDLHQLEEPELDEEPDQEKDGGLGQWLSQFLDRQDN